MGLGIVRSRSRALPSRRRLRLMSTRQISVRARPGAALAAATIMSLPLGSLYAFSVLLVPLEQLLQASRSELASVFGISAVFFTIGANLGSAAVRVDPCTASGGSNWRTFFCWGSPGGRRTLADLAHPRLWRAVRHRRRDGLRRGATMRECGAAHPAWAGQRLSRQSFSSRCHAGRTSFWPGARLGRSASNTCRPGGRDRHDGTCRDAVGRA